MELTFIGRKVEVTSALKDYATEKFQKLERRHANINNVNITFHVDHVTHTAEASLHLNGADFHASAEGTDMYAAIDELIDKLIAQITKHKEKVSDHHR